jgi:ubiquinone/menaquinone biosynthesis C-methylase UbiE
MEPSSVSAVSPQYAVGTKPLDEPRIRRWMARQCADADPVLDVGCGAGELCADLARRGHRVTGVDTDPAQLTAARRTAARGGPHGAPEWLQDDGEVLGRLGDARFGAATLVFVLHHMAEPGAGLRAAWRVLRPGGRLLVAEMLPKGPEAGDLCHRIGLEQWLAWFAALEPADLRLLAPADEEWLLVRLGKAET